MVIIAIAIAHLSHVMTLRSGVVVRLIFMAITRSPHSSHEVVIGDTFVVKADNYHSGRQLPL